MKAKLIKHKFGYNLVDTNGEFIATSKDEYSNGVNLKYWLSKENCDEIFGVVSPEVMMKDIECNCDKTKEGYIIGFQMAMELNKDKVFTEKDMEIMFEFGYRKNNLIETTFKSALNFIQSSQKPTEIEVEIVMEPYHDGEFIDDGKTHIVEPKWRPKFDEDGCLILKRI
jgi:hypothetical protein